MHIREVRLQNFRCFHDQQFSLGEKFVVIVGKNGSGKTSLLEALHYSCYLRSFRTYLNRELVGPDQQHFFIQVDFDLQNLSSHEQVQIGYSEKDGKLVKLNQKPIQTYKELIGHYRIISLTADDIILVTGSPEERREFLNYSLLLLKPNLLPLFKRYKHILEQRNKILMQQAGSFQEELAIWSEKLWEDAQVIQQERIAYLAGLEKIVNELLAIHFSTDHESLQVIFSYAPKKRAIYSSFKEFWQHYQDDNLAQELAWRRTLFGAHLDDFSITFQQKRARIYASRGQQKLIVFLIKVAQLMETQATGEPGILLLDDFLTDFDSTRVANCIATLKSLNAQIIITSPVKPDTMIKAMDSKDFCLLEL